MNKKIKLSDIKKKLNQGDICKLNAKVSYPEMIGNKILDTRNNLKSLLDLHNITVKYNVMLRKREITIPGVTNFIDEEENAFLYDIYQIAVVNSMPITRLDKHLDALSWLNTYHPIVQSMSEKPWDKIPRLDDFIKTLSTRNDDFSHKIVKRWMISAIAAAHSVNGFSSQGVLVLQGKQFLGKTSWIKMLDPFNCGAVQEGLLIDPNNKDSITRATSCWIGEISELDGTFRKSDLAPLKSFITNSSDIVRLPFAPRNTTIHRRSVYAATVNDSKFLIDDTGNRRWWTIEVEKINFDHGLDMQQVWAEVRDIHLSGAQTFLNREEMESVNTANLEHEQIDPIKEKILSTFDFCENWSTFNTQLLTSTQVLEKIGYCTPTKSEATRTGTIIQKLTGKKPERRMHRLPVFKSF